MELNFKLTEFEGPLDLLLHLIDKAQIAIEDIFVSDITEQYLEYVNTLPEINMESASEFLATAADAFGNQITLPAAQTAQAGGG